MEIWAVKHRYLLIPENMLKIIATVCSEFTIKHGNKANYNTDYTVRGLIFFFFVMIGLKRDQKTD